MKKNIVLAIAAAITLAAAGSASAATATGSVSPTATVEAACVIDSATMAFGTVSGVIKSNIDIAGTINLSCSGNVPFSIGANEGANGAKAKTAGRRAMIAGTSATGIDYDLFTDNARTLRLNTSTNLISSNSGAGGAFAVPLHGRIFPQTYAQTAGVVSDTVALTVTF